MCMGTSWMETSSLDSWWHRALCCTKSPYIWQQRVKREFNGVKGTQASQGGFHPSFSTTWYKQFRPMCEQPAIPTQFWRICREHDDSRMGPNGTSCLKSSQTSFGSCFLDKPIYLQVVFLDSTGKRILMLESSLVLVAQRAWRNTHIAGSYGILPPESLHTLELYSIHLIF